jgi:hypothetical protein
MSQQNQSDSKETPVTEPVQTGQSSQAPAEGDIDQAEQSDKSQGQSSEAPATG